MNKSLATLLCAIAIVTSAHAQVIHRSDSELRALIQKHVWYSARHGYQFLSDGTIVVDGYRSKDSTKWQIVDGKLYRKYSINPGTDVTKIIEINDRQLVEQEIAGPNAGAVEVMYSQR